jgi:SsrA-binding protein
MSIIQNKKAFHDYFIEDKYEAGVVFEGWEVKSIRAGRVQLKEAYVIVRKSELYLIGCNISPLSTASTHINPDPIRTRKLLLHAEEITRLIGKVDRSGYTLVKSNLKLVWPKEKNSTINVNQKSRRNGYVIDNVCYG